MSDQRFPVRSVAGSALVPAMLYEIGNGAIAPIVALTALDDGASAAVAGLALAVLGVGQVLGDVPAGWLADRVGERRAMMCAALLDIAGLLVCVVAHSTALLMAGLLAIGVATATYYLGRQSYLTEVVPVRDRAGAMSTLGGFHRVGLFVGPFIGSAAISIGGLRAAYWVAAGAAFAAALLLAIVPDVPAQAAQPAAARGAVTAWSMLRRHTRLFATLGACIVLVGTTRAARQTALPLWAAHLHLSPASISLIFGVASAFDVALFYPAGKVMDQFGRLSVAVPSLVLLGGTLLWLPLTHEATTFAAVACLMSAGNGIGSGIVMTLGSDVAPAESRTRFLSIWRICNDSGNAAGPLLLSVMAALLDLAAGIAAIGAVGLLAAVLLARTVGRFTPLATRSGVLRHRAHAAQTGASGAQAQTAFGTEPARCIERDGG